MTESIEKPDPGYRYEFAMNELDAMSDCLEAHATADRRPRDSDAPTGGLLSLSAGSTTRSSGQAPGTAPPPRRYPDPQPPIGYPGHFVVKHVTRAGTIRLLQQDKQTQPAR